MARAMSDVLRMLAFFDTELSFEAFIICDNYSAQAQNVIFSVTVYPSLFGGDECGVFVLLRFSLKVAPVLPA